MNDLSAFDGDAERERQIVDLRVKGKTEVSSTAHSARPPTRSPSSKS
jgi:hypothetical protein